jgi:hypothetical protein
MVPCWDHRDAGPCVRERLFGRRDRDGRLALYHSVRQFLQTAMPNRVPNSALMERGPVQERYPDQQIDAPDPSHARSDMDLWIDKLGFTAKGRVAGADGGRCAKDVRAASRCARDQSSYALDSVQGLPGQSKCTNLRVGHLFQGRSAIVRCGRPRRLRPAQQ